MTFIPGWISSKILNNVKPFDTEKIAKFHCTETFSPFIFAKRTRTNIFNIVHNLSISIKCACVTNIYQKYSNECE